MHKISHPRSYFVGLAALSVWLFGAGGAWGQALPQAGQVGRDLLPSVPEREAGPVIAPVPSTTSAPAAGSAVSVSVTAFIFTGNASISTDELQAVVASSLNQKLDLAGLDKVTDSVSRYYVSKGFTVAKAYLPAQQAAGGVIQITVIEGRYGAINLKNNTLIKDERFRLMMFKNICNDQADKDCVGQTIQDEGLERAILLLKDLPGITAVASLKPGEAIGTSDLLVEAKTTKSTAYSLGLDNYGAPSTGLVRLNASADMNNLGKGGDQVSLGISTTNTTGTQTGSATYSVPIGYSGQRAGIAYSRSEYRLGASFSATQSHGISNAVSAFTSYPIQRSVNQSLYLRGSVEVRGAANYVDLVGSSFQTNANVVRLGLTGDRVDSIYGGGYNVYGLTMSQGYLGTNDPNDGLAAGAHTAGRFGKVAYNYARQQAMNGPVTLYGSFNGQIGSKNLDGSEQTGLGGPSSVRGYGGEAGGSSGAGATIEVRYTKPIQIGSELSNITYATFFDRGWVQYYQNPIAVGSVNSRSLSSYGLSMTIQSQARVPTPTSLGYFARAMIGMHSMGAAQQSIVDASSRGKFWIQGGVTF